MNRLANETSPYLRQHAENPVDWFPWGDEAFELARATDRPVFVSIGYSACHWCHVMAHESFEDPATAALLNDRFVAVKVDREEHPDVDAVYMEAVQTLTGSGGWPLTVFCGPDRRPFFGGTYFPKDPGRGMPAFGAVLTAVSDAWSDRRAELSAQADELTSVVEERLAPPEGSGERRRADHLVMEALERFRAIYDPEHGGVGQAPKFPQAPMLELLLRADQLGLADAWEMVEVSIEAMASGGLYDHLAGGFARYSVDRTWTVPHFEKMLYDQASLARLYLHAFLVSGDRRWRQVATETLDYVLSDLALDTGGLASAEDADSEGEEGRFYLWRPAEIEAVLQAAGRHDDAAAVLAWYGVDAGPNFEGRSILLRPVRGDLLRPNEIEAARGLLRRARAERVRPGLDDKVLTEWNAMIISVLAEAGLALGEHRLVERAVELAAFLLGSLRREDGRWLRSYQAGRAAHLAVATDYAWLCDAFTRVGEATGDVGWFREAETAAAGLVDLFSAPDGGFYLSGRDAGGLPVRPRDSFDGVLPAATSIAASALARLGALLGDASLLAQAETAVASGAATLGRAPLSAAHLLGAACLLEHGAIEIVVPGDVLPLRQVVARWFLPDAVLAWGAGDGLALFDARVEGVAYVCRGGTCLAPVSEPIELVAAIEAELAATRAAS